VKVFNKFDTTLVKTALNNVQFKKGNSFLFFLTDLLKKSLVERDIKIQKNSLSLRKQINSNINYSLLNLKNLKEACLKKGDLGRKKIIKENISRFKLKFPKGVRREGLPFIPLQIFSPYLAKNVEKKIANNIAKVYKNSISSNEILEKIALTRAISIEDKTIKKGKFILQKMKVYPLKGKLGFLKKTENNKNYKPNWTYFPIGNTETTLWLKEKSIKLEKLKKIIKTDNYQKYTKFFSIKIPLEDRIILHIRIIKDKFYAKILADYQQSIVLLQNLNILNNEITNLGFKTSVIKLVPYEGKPINYQRGDKNDNSKDFIKIKADKVEAYKNNSNIDFTSFSFFL